MAQTRGLRLLIDLFRLPSGRTDIVTHNPDSQIPPIRGWCAGSATHSRATTEPLSYQDLLAAYTKATSNDHVNRSRRSAP